MLRVRKNATLFWRWFGYWRRRYIWLRLAILLVIFAPTIYEVKRPLIRQLVVYAVTAIDNARWPTPFYKAQLLRARETKALQRSLLARFDTDRDGRLEATESRRLREATGLSAKDVTESVLRADYDHLLAAAQELHVATRFSTPREMRSWAHQTAQTEETRWHDQQWAEVERELRLPRPRARDYLRWTTWARGIGWFRGRIGELLDTLVPPIFAGVSHAWMSGYYTDQPPVWRTWKGYVGWGIVLALVVISVRSFARRQELERRFQEDPVFAEAPCPICGRPTHDFGALREFRPARALGLGAVVGLAASAVSALGLHGHSEPTGLAMWSVPLALAVVAAVLRYLLWPREVHACHRRPRLHVIAFAGSVVVVVAPLATLAALWMGALR